MLSFCVLEYFMLVFVLRKVFRFRGLEFTICLHFAILGFISV